MHRLHVYNAYSDICLFAQIDHGHEVAWLSELRMMSVVFINLELKINHEGKKKLTLLQSIFEAVYISVVKYEGQLWIIVDGEMSEKFVHY